MKTVKQLLAKLSNFYWSPEHPSHYVLQLDNGREKGVGLIAYQNYGAFNLAWGSNQGRADTEDHHITLAIDFSKYRRYTAYKMGEQTVGDWACMLRPKEFLSQCLETPVENTVIKKELMDVAVRAMGYDLC